MPTFAEQIIMDNDYAHSLRTRWETLWQDLADYELPSMADFTQRISPGQQRGSKIVNSIGVLSARECAIRVNAFLTGDGTNWFDLRIPDAWIENDPQVRGWLDQLKQVMYAVFNSPGSGFGTAKEPTYRQLTVFGNGPLFIGETAAGWPVYRAEFLGNCAIWTDDDNKVIALFREYQNTAWGLARQFGEENLPHSVKGVLATEPQRKFTCVHGVRPRMDTDPFDIAGKPYIEGYVLKETGDLLEKARGYWEFPWVFPRWSVSPNESYGRGPGEDAIQDVKGLQRMETDVIKRVSMDVDPMWLTDDESGASPRINQVPGGMVYGRQDVKGNWNIEALRPSGSANDGMAMIEKKERLVESLFFLDAFRMVEKISKSGSVVHMSATEFAGRQAEQFRFAGPPLERQRAEFLFMVISRTASILIRNRKVPPPPPQLRGAPIHAEYVSPMGRARLMSDASPVLELIGDMIPLAQIDQKALDIINVPRAGRVLARARHVPQEVLNSPEEIAAVQKARSDVAAEARQTEQMVAAAGAAKDSAGALKLLGEGGEA
ncbi:hypothetical protein LCGC14_1135440 [marine sediment metagenome]|uniref:Bacteriophage head to tail connecting protein n=1 Tax=marine sediment metagenome TaxID=412755 RepID=A0A0F9MMR7_9ZZZZ